jgi:hypothetical protein
MQIPPAKYVAVFASIPQRKVFGHKVLVLSLPAEVAPEAPVRSILQEMLQYFAAAGE